MFKKEENMNEKEIETIIGASVKVEGEFVGEGNVVVEGIMSGNLKTNRNLKVGDKAKIFANVKANNAIISGEVNGNIHASEMLELTSTARVIGDIKAKIIVVAPGAVFNGKCEMIGNEEAKNKKEKNGEK